MIPLNNRDIALTDDGKKKQKLLKEDMYNNLKSMLEHGEIYLLDDDDVKASLRSIKIDVVRKENEQTKTIIYYNRVGNYSGCRQHFYFY